MVETETETKPLPAPRFIITLVARSTDDVNDVWLWDVEDTWMKDTGRWTAVLRTDGVETFISPTGKTFDGAVAYTAGRASLLQALVNNISEVV